MSAAYRWNQSQAAADYDAAGPVLHPFYNEIQDALLAELLPRRGRDRPWHAVDLGGGSGRLAERILAAAPQSSVTLVDRSAAFLDLARRRLARFAERAAFVECQAQDDWPRRVPVVDAIVSTSALHHLEPAEKRAVFQECHGALRPGGLLINGDEHRPDSDAAYRRLLEAWGSHMETALAEGRIPATFGEILAKWRERNLDNFGGPRQSGDDCHETVEAQTDYLRRAGFESVRVPWAQDLWVVTVAEKPPAKEPAPTADGTPLSPRSR